MRRSSMCMFGTEVVPAKELKRRSRSCRPPLVEHRERGATLVEYALGVALLCIATLGAVEFMTDQGKSSLDERGARIGGPDLELSAPGGDDDPGDGGDPGGDDGDTDPEDPLPPDSINPPTMTAEITTAGTWSTTVTFQVSTGASNEPVFGAQITGLWSEGKPPKEDEEPTCRTDDNSGIATCSITIDNLIVSGVKRVCEVSFRIDSITVGDQSYDVSELEPYTVKNPAVEPC